MSMNEKPQEQHTVESSNFGVLAPNESAAVAYFWKKNQTLYVRLVHQITNLVKDFTVLRCARKNLDNFVLLSWNSDEMSKSCLVEISPSGSKSSIKVPANAVTNEILVWNSNSQSEDFVRKLGYKIPDLSGYAKEDLEPEQRLFMQLSNQIRFFNRQSRESTKLYIEKIQNAYGFAFVDLANENADAKQTFAIEQVLRIGGTTYGVMTLPPSLTEGEAMPPVFLVKFTTGYELETLQDHEFELIKARIIALIARCDRQDFDSVKQNLTLATAY